MAARVKRLGYGNQATDGASPFWLSSSLEISALEQVEFLRRLWRGELGFARVDMHRLPNHIYNCYFIATKG